MYVPAAPAPATAAEAGRVSSVGGMGMPRPGGMGTRTDACSVLPAAGQILDEIQTEVGARRMEARRSGKKQPALSAK